MFEEIIEGLNEEKMVILSLIDGKEEKIAKLEDEIQSLEEAYEILNNTIDEIKNLEN